MTYLRPRQPYHSRGVPTERVRRDSRTGRVVAACCQPGGATLADIAEAYGRTDYTDDEVVRYVVRDLLITWKRYDVSVDLEAGRVMIDPNTVRWIDAAPPSQGTLGGLVASGLASAVRTVNPGAERGADAQAERQHHK